MRDRVENLANSGSTVGPSAPDGSRRRPRATPQGAPSALRASAVVDGAESLSSEESTAPSGEAPADALGGASEHALRPDPSQLPRVDLPRRSLPLHVTPSSGEPSTRRARGHTTGRCGFEFSQDPHAARRTAVAPPPAVNKMSIDTLGIPKGDMRHLHALVATAAHAYLFLRKTFSDQKRHRMAAAISYLELYAPRLAVCVRSWGACALLSLKDSNKVTHVRGAESTPKPRAVADATHVAVAVGTAGTAADTARGAAGTASTGAAAVGRAGATGQHMGPAGPGGSAASRGVSAASSAEDFFRSIN